MARHRQTRAQRAASLRNLRKARAAHRRISNRTGVGEKNYYKNLKKAWDRVGGRNNPKRRVTSHKRKRCKARPTFKGANKHCRHPKIGTQAYYVWLKKTYGHKRGKSAKRVKTGKKMFRSNHLSKWASKVKHGQVHRNRKGQITSFRR